MKFLKLVLIAIFLAATAQAATYNLGAFWKNGAGAIPMWTWVNGDPPWQPSFGVVYGTKGTAAAANLPGGRQHAATASDATGNIWYFGGSGYGADGSYGELDDIWKYNTTTGQWTWISGSGNLNVAANWGTKNVAAGSNTPGGRNGSSAWMDPSGNYFWIFGGRTEAQNQNFNDTWKYTIATGQWTWVSGDGAGYGGAIYGTKGVPSTSNQPNCRYFAASAIDASGIVWIYGGYSWVGSDVLYNDFWKFNTATAEWTWVGGGDGVDTTTTVNQVSVPGTKGVANATNWPSSRMSYGWIDASGNFWMIGGAGFTDNGSDWFKALNNVWMFDKTLGQWIWKSGSTGPSMPAVRGTQGVGATTNEMNGRDGFEIWKDGSGVIWVWGGNEADFRGYAGSNYGNYSDLWKFNPSDLKWTYVSGPATMQDGGTWGALGVASTSYNPSSRAKFAGGQDAAGNFYLFSGEGTDGGGSRGILMDVWRLEPSTLKWTWVNGNKTLKTYFGIGGTKGVASASNNPGSRNGGAVFTDSSKNVWLFGGDYGYLYQNGHQAMNSFWKYNPTASQWTWVSGTVGVCGTAAYGTPGVGSTSNIPPALTYSGTAKDPSGNFWIFGGSPQDCDAGYSNQLWKFEPANGKWTFVNGPTDLNGYVGVYGTKGVASGANRPGSRYSAKLVADSSGNLWMFGGDGIDEVGNWIWMNDLWKFDVSLGQWIWMAGDQVGEHSGVYGTKGVASGAVTPGSRRPGALWIDASNNLYLFGGGGYDSVNGSWDYLNDVFKFDGTNWAWINGSDVTASGGNSAIYSSDRQFAAGNTIGGRDSGGAGAQSGTSVFYFFGGQGQSASSNWVQSEVWSYAPAINQWACMASCNNAFDLSYGTKGVAAPGNTPGVRAGITGAMDSDSNFYVYGGWYAYRDVFSGDLWKFK